MALIIPGFKSVKDYSDKVGVAYMTVVNQMKRGFCPYPQRRIDGSTSHPLYKTWENMLTRCYNPEATGYHNYGGRGIKVCKEWRHNFQQFLQDVGDKPTVLHTLDRIDVHGNYEPSNVRWATPEEQASNKQAEPAGVHFDKSINRWKIIYKEKYVKSFKEEEEARLFLEEFRQTLK
jgi:hypothetical protein